MRTVRRIDLLHSLLLLALTFCGALPSVHCGGSAGGTDPGAPLPVKTGPRVEISAPMARVGLGDKLPLTTTVFDQAEQGQPVPAASMVWTMSDPLRAVIADRCELPCVTSNLVGMEVGVVDVTASYMGVSGSLRITIEEGTGAWGEGYLYGSPDNEGGENVVVDSGGNVYVAGATAKTLDGQLRASGASDSVTVVTRFLPNGKKAWSRLIVDPKTLLAAPSNSSSNGIALARGGGVFVGSSNSRRSVLARVTPSGEVEWLRSFPGALVDVAADAAGNVYITGDAERPAPGGETICPDQPNPSPTGVVGGGASDGYLAKLSAGGGPVWCRMFSYLPTESGALPTFDTVGVAIKLDETRGAVYVEGLVQLNAFYGLNPFLRRFDLASGNTQWMKFINPTGTGDGPTRVGSTFSAEEGRPYAIAVDSDGNAWSSVLDVLLDPQTKSTLPPVAYVVKTSPEGAELLRRVVKVAAPPASNQGDPASQPVFAIVHRPLQNDVVLLGRRGGFASNSETAAVIGMTLAGEEKWRVVLEATPVSTTFTPPGLLLKDIATTVSGDLFAVGETAGNFAGFSNQTQMLTNLQTLGTDIAVAHLGVRP